MKKKLVAILQEEEEDGDDESGEEDQEGEGDQEKEGAPGILYIIYRLSKKNSPTDRKKCGQTDK